MSRTKNKGILPVIALIGAFIGSAIPAMAQGRAALPIAYIRMQRILAEAVEARAAAQELDALRQAKAQELAAKKQALDDTRLQLANAGGYFSATKRTGLQDKVKSQEAELQQLTQQAQTDLQNLQRTVQDRLRSEIDDNVKAIAAQRGVQWVFNKDAALVVEPPGGDLTDEVLARMNAAAAQRQANAAAAAATTPAAPANK